MAIGELFLSAFLQALFQTLISPDMLHFAGGEGLHSTLKKWERRLKTIESVLSDAEEKRLTDSSVKMWLDDLQDLAYDVDDILDEFATEALRRKLLTGTADAGATSSSSKVRGVFTACFHGNWSPTAIKFSVRIGSNIKTITSGLDELCKQKAEFGLKEIVGKASTTSPDEYQRPPTSCLPTEFAVYGRDEEKAEVLKMVLRDDEPKDANFGVVAIIGMGGLGKTTLARQVYNDKEVKDFEPKAWVCVSGDFDLLRISKAILESITFNPCDLKDLNQVQLQLKNALAGKKFLLVLDDVWNNSYTLWETLRSPLMYGAPGSKVIVTTRSIQVASTMGTNDYCKLKLLSDDDSWSLFKKHALQNKDINAHHNIGLIREKVVNKCRGLPLAVKTLGGLLLSKQRDEEWEDILSSSMWDLSDENEILPVLKLSYRYLPSHLKRCFAYSSILPRDYEFNKKDLVLLWMAEGLIQKQKENKQLEDVGYEYFDELLARSIFQPSIINKSKYVMHDLVHDLAQWVVGETSFTLEEKGEDNKQLKMSQRVRHFSFISTRYERKNKFEVLHKVENLRTFLAIPRSNTGYGHSYVSSMVVFDLLKYKKLRALSLENYRISQLPDSIGGLIHLRYLNLSGTIIKSLPESACSLFNLQTLILSYCFRLVKLPCNMENMSNLRHLDIRGTNLSEMPLGIKELKDLQTLSDFIVGKNGSGCALEGLKDFKFLKEELRISKLEKVMSTRDTGEAILSNKRSLKVVELEWDAQFGDVRNEAEEKKVLENLQPHTNLRSLTIKCYSGIRFPSWLGDPSFSNMTVLSLQICKNCTSLPSLGLLSSLKYLTIIGMKRLKTLASEFYGEGCVKPFRSLEVLRFEDLQEWDTWETPKKIEHVETFSSLRELSIQNCPKLFGKLPDHLPSLQNLVIRECEQLMVSLFILPGLCNLEVNGCKSIEWCSPSDSHSLKSITLSNISRLGNWSMQEFQKVESLYIFGCEELIHLLQNEKTPKELQTFNSIRKLRIGNCPNLVLFPEICFLPLLTQLRIQNCYALMSLPEGMGQTNVHLERLQIDGNHSLPFLTRRQLPSSLKVVELFSCEKLQYVFGDADETCTSSSTCYSVLHKENITFLERLTLRNCPSLTCLSTRDQLPATLKYLHINGCSKITTISKGHLPDSLQDLSIYYCPNLESITNRFHSIMLLETITIYGCKSFESIPEGLHKLSRLCAINIYSCPSLVCFSEEGLPNTNLRLFYICDCKNLGALPKGLQTLDTLHIWQCPSIKSFPEECSPSRLTSLTIGNLNMYEQLISRLASLTKLILNGCPDVVSFEIGTMLPTSLTYLQLSDLPKLKHLTSDGFQNLTSLVYLAISECPNLISFPKIGLPSLVKLLQIYECPMLQKRCRRDKGQEWSKIAHIPCVEINWKFMDDLEEEE